MYDEETNTYTDKGVQSDSHVSFITSHNDGNNRLHDTEGFNYFYWDLHGFLYLAYMMSATIGTKAE